MGMPMPPSNFFINETAMGGGSKGGGGSGGKQKARFDGLDVAAMTSHLRRSMLGHKVANIYDGTALSAASETSSARSTYVFKLANPNASAVPAGIGGSGGGAKEGKEKDGKEESDAASSSNRAMLLIESGVRFHPTTYAASSTTSSDGRSMPSPFTTKLRKHLRNSRLENVTQLGNLDRVVDFRFGSGRSAHHLILELYAQGNLILCDSEYRILALLRTHEYAAAAAAGGGDEEKKKEEKDEDEVKVRVGSVYPVQYATTLGSSDGDAAASTSTDETEDGGSGSNDGDASAAAPKQLPGLLSLDGPASLGWARSELEAWKSKIEEQQRAAEQQQQQQQQQGGGGKGKKGGGGGRKGGGGSKRSKKDDAITLKALLLKPSSGVYHFGPSLLEHCIVSAGLNGNTKLTLENLDEAMPAESWSILTKALREEGLAIVDRLANAEGGGYVLYRPKDDKDDKDDAKDDSSATATGPPIPHADKVFEEFQPHLLRQHADRPHIRYPTFAAAVDEFFSLIEGQKRALRADAAEAAARDRLERIRRDQENRLAALERDMERMKENAQLVEANADDVDKALLVINSAVDSGMDWEALDSLVEVEQRNGNPIALLVKKLDLANEAVTLSLPDVMNGANDDGTMPVVDIKISLAESAHANARAMFEKYRSAKEKSQKTIEASTKALKAAEATAQKQLEEAQKRKVMTTVVPQRKQHWFEKFHWMITSDNYLVVGGRDAQQNEQLVKRYLRPGDAYLHADVHGAASVILRAKRRRTSNGKTEVLPLSDQALREAGSFTICRSSAWSSRMVTSAWWVESHQVSKTAPTGEYLTVGSFMIRGKKNFLPASQLEMGIGVVFRLGDEASIARHVNDRRDFALLERESSREAQMEEDGDGVVSEASNDTKPKAAELRNNRTDTEDGLMPEEKKDIEDSTAGEETNDTAQAKKKGISARERRLMKRGQSSTGDDGDVGASSPAEITSNKSDKQKQTNQPKKKDVQLSRGKKAKMKRAAKKYKDQDDEEKELAMMALHAGEKKNKKKGKGSKQVAEETSTQLKAASEAAELLVRDASKVAEKLPEDVSSLLASCVTVKNVAGGDDEEAESTVRWDKFDADVIEQLQMLSLDGQKAAAKRLSDLNNMTRIDNYSASLAGIIRAVNKYGHEHFAADTEGDTSADGKQRKTKAEKEAEKEAWREILAEDGILEGEGADIDQEIDDRAEIGKLTGTPHSNDVLLYALPVCAPYSTLSKYKYRVKLTPGSLKRGKAGKQAIEMFLRGENSKNPKDEQLQKLIKAVGDNEWTQSMIGEVKLSSAGASKIAKKQKAQKKGGKKKKG